MSFLVVQRSITEAMGVGRLLGRSSRDFREVHRCRLPAVAKGNGQGDDKAESLLVEVDECFDFVVGVHYVLPY